MTRTNIDIDDEACAAIMKRYGLSTKREAVNFAMRMLTGNRLAIEESRVPYDAGTETQPVEIQPPRLPRQFEVEEGITYRRATIEEARRMRGEADFDVIPTREEWLNRPLVPMKRPTIEEILSLEGSGWDGDLDEMRRNTPQLEAWLNRPDDEPLPNLEDGSSRAPDNDSPRGQRPR